jgi:hypothetical protein
MAPDTGISDIAHVIQLSVAPVFLLMGIGSMLIVLTNRLARVIDRSRVLAKRAPDSVAEIESIASQIHILSLRARHASRAIVLCTATALLICSVIALLFLAAIFGFDVYVAVAILFIAAMIALILGLILFLREVLLATYSLRIGKF